MHGHKRGAAKGFIAWTYMWKKVVLGVGWYLTSEVPPYNRPDVTIMVDWALKTSSLYPLYSFCKEEKSHYGDFSHFVSRGFHCVEVELCVIVNK